MAQDSPLKVLILAGGLSSRMGSPKHLLEYPDGNPVYIHLLEQLRLACPDARGFYMSLRDTEAIAMLPPLKDQAKRIAYFIKLPLCFVTDYPGTNNPALHARDIGPAAGLLAAHKQDPTCHWLVVACDYPLLRSTDIRQLYERYEEPLTCFENGEGWAEPLLAIWSPEALKRLEKNVENDIIGLKHVVRALNAKIVRPLREEVLFNTNTNEDWEHALTLAESMLAEEPQNES